jgi:SOS-response transcriptional repressor LexA
MHTIQEKLLQLSKKQNLSELSLRDMAEAIGMMNESPQKIKHHLIQLEKKGFLTIHPQKGLIPRDPNWAKGLLEKGAKLFSIPLIGTANCGPANIFAETNFQGFLKISNNLLGKKNSTGLFAIKADGTSMNRAEIEGKRIEDGDYVIVDSNQNNPINGQIYLVIVDNKATIKRYIEDKENNQIVLMADSSYDYEPIYLHEDDDFTVNGRVINVIKRPVIK